MKNKDKLYYTCGIMKINYYNKYNKQIYKYSVEKGYVVVYKDNEYIYNTNEQGKRWIYRNTISIYTYI